MHEALPTTIIWTYNHEHYHTQAITNVFAYIAMQFKYDIVMYITQEIVTHQLTLDDAEEGLKLVVDGRTSLKVVVLP